MGNRVVSIVYVVVLVSVIVGVDVAFLRHHSAARLVVNVALVLVFAAVYWAFVRRS
jgi:hypothetical protein